MMYVSKVRSTFEALLGRGSKFQNKPFRGGSDGPVERSISHSHPSKDGRFSNGGRGGGRG